MASSVFTATCFLCLASMMLLLLGQQATADSCIAFRDYFSPGYTYRMQFTKNPSACCTLCAKDNKCVSWSRDDASGLCGLKTGCDILVSVSGVTSGVKYSGRAPSLRSNDVGAFVLAGTSPKRPAPKPSQGGVVTASSVAVSTGGSASATVIADGNDIFSASSVSGPGSTAKTSASNPKISLKTSLKGEDGAVKKLAVKYYGKTDVKGEVLTVLGNKVPIVNNAKGEPTCYTCDDFRCLYTKGVLYRGSAKVVVADTTTNDIKSCCQLCRRNPQCYSWWRNPTNKRCVLNSNIPAKQQDQASSRYAGGIYI